MTPKTLRLTRLSTVLIGGALAVWIFSTMRSLPLWGHYPLALNIILWIVLQAILAPWFYKGKAWEKYWLCSTAAGFLLYFSFPDFMTTFLVFVAWVPLLWVDSQVSRTRQVMPYAMNTFLIWNITTTFWLINTDIGAGIFTFVFNTLLMTVAFGLYAWVRRQLPERYAAIVLIATWISFELFHFRWDISFPWLTLGHVWGRYPWTVQWYEWTGVFGGTLWILIVNHTILRAFAQKHSRIKWSAVALSLVIVPLGISLVMDFDEEKGQPMSIGLIQPDFEPHHEKFVVPETVQARRFVKLSESIVDSVDVLIYPEASFGFVLLQDVERYPALMILDTFLRKHPQVDLMVGLDAGEWTEADDPSPTVRPYDTPRGLKYWKRHNSALLFQGQVDKNFQIYKKSKLVPGAEKFPYHKLFAFMKPVVERIGGSVYGFEPQERRSPLVTRSGPLGAVICYESVYGQYSNGYSREGAQALAVLTNDAWWDNTSGHRQHLRIASLRAIEQRKWIARSTNSGVSSFFDPQGRVIKPTQYGEPDAIHHTVYLNEARTAYMQWGDLIARISLFLFLFLILAAFAQKIKGVRQVGT